MKTLNLKFSIIFSYKTVNFLLCTFNKSLSYSYQGDNFHIIYLLYIFKIGRLTECLVFCSMNLLSQCVAHLTHMVGTIIKVLSAVATRPADGALAFIAGAMVDASCSILTRIELLGAESNLSLTKLSCVASWTRAGI